MAERKVRVLIAKPGLDGHDRGAKVVARALRDAGMEVIYTGLRQTPEMIASAAVQEDVDVVGLSCLSGAHMTLFPRVVDLLRQGGRGDVLVFGGGIIPPEDVPKLREKGVAECFGPGTPTGDIVAFVRGWKGDGGLVGKAAARTKRTPAKPAKRAPPATKGATKRPGKTAKAAKAARAGKGRPKAARKAPRRKRK